MKSITLREALLIYIDYVLENSTNPNLYLKDLAGQYHLIDTIDLNKSGMICDDGYYDTYKYILEVEKLGKHKLFIKE